jgi:hypothetical protein
VKRDRDLTPCLPSEALININYYQHHLHHYCTLHCSPAAPFLSKSPVGLDINNSHTSTPIRPGARATAPSPSQVKAPENRTGNQQPSDPNNIQTQSQLLNQSSLLLVDPPYHLAAAHARALSSPLGLDSESDHLDNSLVPLRKGHVRSRCRSHESPIRRDMSIADRNAVASSSRVGMGGGDSGSPPGQDSNRNGSIRTRSVSRRREGLGRGKSLKSLGKDRDGVELERVKSPISDAGTSVVGGRKVRTVPRESMVTAM